MACIKFLVITFVLLLAPECQSARILALFPFPAKSHFTAFSILLEELVKRGHEMTVISAYPRTSPLANYTDIAIEDYYRETKNAELDWFKKTDSNPIDVITFLWKLSLSNCERFLNYPQIQKFIRSNQKFDLILYEPFFTECTYGLVHKFNAPFIQIISNTLAVWMGEGVGNPNVFSYMPEFFLSYSDHMSFKERLLNSLIQTFMILGRNFYVLPKMETIMRKYSSDPNLPSIHELETNASFLLLNSHVSINHPRPLTPNTAEVGGMHIKEAKKLPQDLQKYLDDASQGVIYFSLGSIVRTAAMPEATRNAFIHAFSKMKQKVLWKWEDEVLPRQPKNVHIKKWLPQNEILAHSNVKIFITHGGLLSTQEATYYGKPIIAMPIMGDQRANALRAQRAGYAQVLDVHNVTAESLLQVLNEVLMKPSYAANAKRLSKILRDQPQKPLEQAVFWIEYVLRHNGAPHMKSAALRLNFFQYYLLDVLATVLLSLTLLLVSTVLVFRAVCHCAFSRKKYISQARKDN